MATFGEARDSILGLFTVAWDADTPAVNDGVVPILFYDGLGKEGDKPHDAAWARIQVRHTLGGLANVGFCPGSQRRTTKLGVITVQVFSPLFDDRGAPRGLQLNEDLTSIATSAFTGKVAGDVWFKNVRPNEIGPDSAWYQTNVIAEFEYDEFV